MSDGCGRLGQCVQRSPESSKHALGFGPPPSIISRLEACDSVAGPDRKKQKRKRDLFTVSLDDQDEIVTYTDKEHGVTYKAGGDN